MQPEINKPVVHEGMTEVEQMKRGMLRTVVNYGLVLLAGLLLVLIAPRVLRVLVLLHGDH